MTTTLDRQEFVNALAMLKHVVGTRTTLPVLSMAKITADDSGFTLTGTNLDVAVSVNIDSKGPTGSVLIPAAKAHAILSSMTGDLLTIAWDDKKCHLECGSQKCSLFTLPVEEFPPPPKITGQKILVKQSDMVAALKATAYAMSEDPSRYTLQSINMVFAENTFDCVATDGRRLAHIHLDTESKEKAEFMLPAATVKLLQKLIQTEWDFLFTIGENNVRILFGEVTLDSKLVEGQYVNWKQVIPSGGQEVPVKIADWMQAITVCNPMTSRRMHGIRVGIGGGLVTLQSASESGDATVSFPVDFKGYGITFMVDPAFLSDALAGFGEMATLHYVDEFSQLRLTSENKQAVIVPLRLN
jgi:DNA polymerase III subunit beta